MNKPAKETRELNPKLLLLLICGFNLFIVCFACEGLPRLQSHRRMNELIASVEKYPLPPDTRVKSIESEILESPGGTGDYCLYDIEQEMVTTLSKDEIESYYENAAVPGVNSFGNERGIMVYFPDEQPDDNELLFIIAIYDMTEHIFTPRCK
jgi:hypothetical protein